MSKTDTRNSTSAPVQKVRLDKWLWAARFFKTRALAKQAVESGKVQSDGQKMKPGREIGMGIMLTIRQGWDERTVEVINLSEQRRSAPEAQQLYRETAESVEKREQLTQQRKAQAITVQDHNKPDKRDRRLRQRIKQGDFD
jgi:ribosome-associated heat shock protein Hsp15